MFGFFRKKPSAIDALIRTLYGDKPPKKSANAEQAADLAYDQLLSTIVPMPELVGLARQLSAGPIPYSTHDLAVSVAMSFFKKVELRPLLGPTQLKARAQVLNWLRERLVVPILAKSFEDTLYRLYAPERPTS